VVDAGVASGLRSLVECGAQHPHLDKIVEMTGLERSVLAVVGEAEQLARLAA
jgi:hypothetical protein